MKIRFRRLNILTRHWRRNLTNFVAKNLKIMFVFTSFCRWVKRDEVMSASCFWKRSMVKISSFKIAKVNSPWSICWLALFSLLVCRSSPWWHLHLSPSYDVLDHTNHIFSESLSSGDDNDRDEYLQKDKYRDKDTHTHTQTKTNTKCFQDPMYAIFVKSRWFKDLEYYIDCLLGGHGHDEHGRGGLQCFRDQTICVSHSCTLSSFILLSSGWCLFYFICLTRQCPGASLSEGSFRLLANTSDSHQRSLWFPSQSSKAITCQNFNPPKWIYIHSQWVKFDKFNMKAL